MENNNPKKVSFGLYLLIAILAIAIVFCLIIAVINGPKKDNQVQTPDNEGYEYVSTEELKK